MNDLAAEWVLLSQPLAKEQHFRNAVEWHLHSLATEQLLPQKSITWRQIGCYFPIPWQKSNISAMPLNGTTSCIPWQQNYFYLKNQSLGSRFCVALPFLGLLCGNTREHLFTFEKLL